VSWLKRLVASFSAWEPGFDPMSVYVRFVVGELALGWGFLRVLRYFFSQYHSISAPYTFLLPEGQTVEALGPSKKQ